MTKLVDATLCSQAGCSGLAGACSERFVGNLLEPPHGSENPAIKAIYSADRVLFNRHASKP